MSSSEASEKIMESPPEEETRKKVHVPVQDSTQVATSRHSQHSSVSPSKRKGKAVNPEELFVKMIMRQQK